MYLFSRCRFIARADARSERRATFRSGERSGAAAAPATPDLPTNIIPTKIRRLKTSAKLSLDMRIPPLNFKILLESAPLKSRILVRRLASAAQLRKRKPGRGFDCLPAPRGLPRAARAVEPQGKLPTASSHQAEGNKGVLPTPIRKRAVITAAASRRRKRRRRLL